MRSVRVMFMYVCVVALFLVVPSRALAVWTHEPAGQTYDLSSNDGMGQMPVMPMASRMTLPLSTNAMESTEMIKDLARALEYDPKLLHEYVLNNIEYVPIFGIYNGATGCLLAGRGSDWDQAVLLGALLKESGYDISYKEAPVAYLVSDFMDWYGVATVSNLQSAAGSGGRAIITTGDDSERALVRTWVEADIGGTWYKFDPSFNEYIEHDGVSIDSIIGYDQSTLLSNAMQGATSTSDYVEDANESAISNALSGYVTALLSSIETNTPNISFAELIGGREIQKVSITNYSTSLPKEVRIYTAGHLESWSEVPSSRIVQIQIQHAGINEIVYGHEIANQRVYIVYDAGDSYKPKLYIGEDLIATGNATTVGQKYDLIVTVDHPADWRGGGDMDGSYTFSLESGNTFVLMHDFSGSSEKTIAYQNKILGQQIADGLSMSSDAVIAQGGQTALETGLMEQQLASDALGALADCVAYSIHNMGILQIASSGSYYLDWQGYSYFHSARSSGSRNPFGRVQTLFLSALEHGILEQMQGADKTALSTIRLLQISNGNSKKTYLANTNNWTTGYNIKSRLTNYTTNQQNTIESHINNGADVILPEDGSITHGDWTGYTYAAIADSFAAMMIAGGYSGGYSSGSDWDFSIDSVSDVTLSAYNSTPPTSVPRITAQDPVDMNTGYLLLQTTDLSLGNAQHPRGLSLIRSYDSNQNTTKKPFGYGWTHNYAISATETSDGAAGLGRRNAKDALSFVIYAYVALDLLDSPGVQEWVTSALATKWCMEQLVENVTVIDFGNRSAAFTRMPNGTFVSGAGDTSTLTKSGGSYTYEARFGKKLEFNANGTISSWKDADSNTLSFAYTAATNLYTVTDCHSRTLTFSYSSNLVSGVADSAGRSVSYQYTNDAVQSFTDAEGHDWTYLYDTNAEHYLEATFDPLAQMTSSNKYNALGKVETQRNGNGDLWDFYISDFHGVEEGPEDGRTIHYFDKFGRNTGVEDALGNRTYSYYDGQGNLVTNIDAHGYVTRLSYDNYNNVTSRVDALTNTFVYSYDNDFHLVSTVDPLGNMSRIDYDSNHHVTNIVDALSNNTVITYYSSGLPHTITDPEGNATVFTYNSYGDKATIQSDDAGVVSNVYDSIGNLIAVTDPNGNTTSYTCDDRRILTSSTDARGYIVTNTFDSIGLRVRATDRNGNETTFGYTPTYKVAVVTNAHGGVIRNQYDSRDLLVSRTDARNNVSSNKYDLARRLTSVINALGNSTSYELDASGNVTEATNALGDVSSFTYDKLNRLAETVGPMGYTNLTVYNALGKPLVRIDQKGYQTTFNYDALLRMESQVKPDGIVEMFRYDSTGNMTNFVNGDGKVLRFVYDAVGRVILEEDAEGNDKYFAYDNSGNLTNRIDANGISTSYEYNDANTLQEIKYPNANSVTFDYDANLNVTNMTDSVGTTSYIFDNMNRLSSVTDRHGNIIGYTYDLNGSRSSVTYPGNLVVTNLYDAANSLVSVTDWNNKTTTYSYNDIHSPTGTVYPNSAIATYVWDQSARLSGFTHATNGVSFVERSYVLDGVGNITAETIETGLVPTLQPQVRRLIQNDADMLTQVSQKTTPDVEWATSSYVSDDNGNLQSGGLFGIEYDYENRPTNYVSSVLTNQYEYDGAGNRTRRTISGTTYIDILDRGAALPNVLMVTDNTGTPVCYYVWGRGLIAQVETNGTSRYYHANARGDTLAMTDSSGGVVQQYAYSPYGEVLNSSGSIDNPFTYVGGYGIWSEGDSLYHMKARYYHAGLKRFVTKDPIGLAGGGNLYWYANNNPLYFIDMDGRRANVISGGGSDIYYPHGGFGSVNVPGATFEQRSESGFSVVDEFTKPAQRIYVASGIAATVYVSGYYVAPYVVAEAVKLIAAGTAAVTTGREIMLRIAVSQPMAVVDKMILYYPNLPPARAHVGELINQALPYVEQFAMGLSPGPGGPYKGMHEALSWFAGYGLSEAIFSKENNSFQVPTQANFDTWGGSNASQVRPPK